MATNASPYEDRAVGTLLGLAIGDALAAPVEAMSREQAQIRFGTVDTMRGGGIYLLGPGEVTARVALAGAAALALVQEGELEERLPAGYVAVLDAGVPGMGEVTRASLERIRDGMAPAAAAREVHEALERRSAGIGPAIRAVPFALRHRHDADALVDAVLRDAALTHADPRAGAAAAALALWVRAFLNGEDDARAALASARDLMAERIELPEVLPGDGALERLPVRSTAYAPDVLHGAARHLLATKDTRRAILGAVGEAGAASALGAVTGALAGARRGATRLPDAWRSVLVGATRWERLATRL